MNDNELDLEKKLSKTEEEHDHASCNKLCRKLSELYFADGDPERSVEYAERALLVSKEYLETLDIIDNSQYLAELATKTHNYEVAYRQYKFLLSYTEEENEIEKQMRYSYALGNACWYLSRFEESIENYKVSLKIAKQISDDDITASALTGIGLVKWKQGELEDALSKYHNALVIHEKSENFSEIGRIYNYIAIVYKRQGKFQDAMSAFKHSLSVHEELDDKENMAKVLNNIGNLYRLENCLEKALEYYLRSLNLSEQLQNRRFLASTGNNIGLIYLQMGYLDDAYKFLEKALQVKRKLGNPVDIAHSLNNLGLVCQRLERFESAQENLLEALTIEKEVGDKSGMATSLSLLGNCAEDKEDYSLAEKYLIQSRELFEEIGDVTGITTVLINGANIATKQENYVYAEELLLRGLSQAESINADVLMRDCYLALSNMFKAKGDYQKAYENHLEYEDIKEKLIDQESMNKIHEMQAKYKLDQQEKEAEIYRLKNVELVNANNDLKVLKENLEKRIEIAIEENRKKDLLLLAQSRQAAMGQMMGFIAHQWRQPLNSVGVIVQNISDSFEYDELSEEKLRRDTNNIMDQLQFMSQTISDFRNFFKPDKEKIEFDVNTMIMKIVNFMEKGFSNNNIKLKLELDKNCLAMGYPNEYSQVVLNILNNARDALKENLDLKEKYISISSELADGKSVVKIFNNASVIDEKKLTKIFNPYFTTKESTGGTGLGLYMSRTIIEEHMNGTIEAENKDDGVVFTITI